MTTLGTALVRVLPSMSGFAPALRTGVTGSIAAAGAGLSRAVSLPIIAGTVGATAAAVKFESALADVAKTTTLSDTGLNRLGESVVSMANRMPFTREQILGVVAAAGRFGVADKNLLSFSETALKLGTATNLGAEQAATQLTRLANIVKLPEAQFGNLGSAIVALGNDFPTTEEEIARFSQRLAQVSTISTASAADVLGMSAGMASLGIRSEMGGSAMSRVFFKINDAVKSGGDSLSQFSEIAGMSERDFSQLWGTNSTQAVLNFIGGLQRLNEEGANTPAVLRELGLGEIRVRDTLLRAAGGFDVMTGAVQTSNRAFEENTALQIEYDKRLNTTSAQWEIFKNRLTNIGLQFGQGMLPVMNSMMAALGPVADGIAGLGDAFSGLPGPIRAAAGGFVALTAAIGPLMWMGAVVKSSLMQIATGLSALFTVGSGGFAGGGLAGFLNLLKGAAATAGVIGAGLAVGGGLTYAAMPETGGQKLFGQEMNRENFRAGTRVVAEAIDAGWEAFKNEFTADVRGRVDLRPGADSRPRTPEGRIRGEVEGPPTMRGGELVWPTGPTARIPPPQFEQGPAMGPPTKGFGDELFWPEEVASGEAIIRAMAMWANAKNAIQQVGDAFRSTAGQAAEFNAAISGMAAFNNQFFSLAQIAANYEGALDNLDKSLEDNGFNFDLNTEKGRANQSAVQALASTLESQFISAYDAANGSQTRFMENARSIGAGVLERLQTDLGLTAGQAQELATRLGLTEGDYLIRWEMSGDEEARIRLDLMSSAIGLLNEEARTEIALAVGTGDFEGALAIATAALNDLRRQVGDPMIIKGDASDVGRQWADTKDRLEQQGAATVMITADNSGAIPPIVDVAAAVSNLTSNPAQVDIISSGGSAVVGDINNVRSAAESIDKAWQVDIISAGGSQTTKVINGVESEAQGMARTYTATISAKDNASGTIDKIAGKLSGLKSKTLTITTVNQTINTGVKTKSAEGRFVSGGAWLSTTVGEIPGRRGDELILPLGDESRMRQLLSDPRVGDRVARAMGAVGPGTGGGTGSGGGSGSPNIDVSVYIGDEPVKALVKAEYREIQQEVSAGSRHR
jgi:TP901 family phage tail tape measure protein